MSTVTQNAPFGIQTEKQVVDLNRIAQRRAENELKAKADEDRMFQEVGDGKKGWDDEFDMMLHNRGISLEDAQTRLDQTQRKKSLFAERENLQQVKNGIEKAVNDKLACEERQKKIKEDMAVELTNHEHNIANIRHANYRIGQIDREICSLASPQRHRAVTDAENALISASQRRQELLPQFQQANFRVSELEKYIADPKYRMSDHQYKKTNDEASIDLKDARDFVSRLQPQMTAADNKLADAQKAFDAAKAALLSA